MYPYLDEYDTRRAVALWWRKLSTTEIAYKLDVDEAAVANSLHRWREERYRARS